MVWNEQVDGIGQVVSSLRGQMTFGSTHAQYPEINNSGEVVWQGFGEGLVAEIFSSVNGQVTFTGHPSEDPDINRAGVIVFSEYHHIFMAIPEPATLMLLMIAGLAFLRHRRSVGI